MLEDRRLRALVDGYDRSRFSYADQVLEGPADADRHVEPRRDRSSGKADLVLTRQPAGVGDVPSGRDRGSAEGRGERLELLQVFGRTEPHADADRHLAFVQGGGPLNTRRGSGLGHERTNRRSLGDAELFNDRDTIRVSYDRLQHAGPHGGHLG